MRCAASAVLCLVSLWCAIPALANDHQPIINAEAALIRESGGRVSRTPGLLTLRTDSGQVVTRRDETQCGEGGADFRYEHCIHYYYAGRLDPCRAFLVLKLLPEDAAFEWIEQSTGDSVPLGDRPHPSPTCRHVAVAGASELGGYAGVQVWSRRTDGLTLAMEHAPKEYGLYSFKGWSGEDEVRLGVATWVGDKLLEDLPARVLKKPAGWTYVGPTASSGRQHAE